MFPLIAMAAKFLMPMVTKMAGSLMSGGLSGILGKLGNFGDVLGGLFDKAQETREDVTKKMDKARDTALAAQKSADQFLEKINTSTQALPNPNFNVV